MFDVVWTDPQRESVGERRARKEIERRQKTTDAARTSVCTGTTSSSERPSEKSEHTTFSSLFSSRTIRRVARNASKNRPLSPSIQAPGSSDDSKRKISFFGLDSISSNKNSGKAGSMTSQSSFQPSVRNIDTDLSISRSESRAHSHLSFGHDSISNISDSGPGPSTLSNRKLRSAQDIIQVVIPDPALADGIMAEVPEIEDPTSPVSRDSVFSKWTTPSVYTQSTAFDLAFETSHQYSSSMDNKYSSHAHKSGQSSITTLGSKPFAAPRQSKDYDPDVLKPKSASSFKGDSSSTGRPPTPPETPQNQQTHNISLQPIIYDNDDFEDDSRVDDQSSAVTSIKTIDLQDFPVNFRLSASHSPGSLSGWIQAFGPNDQASWKTPDEWEDEPEKNNTIASKVNVEDLLADEDTLPHHPPPREPTLVEQFQVLQDSTKTMKSACDKTILFALNRNWGSEQDAAVYREMEMEKKRWMLTAIHNISQEEERKPLPASLVVKSSHAGRIMCLFESPGVASFVSTSNPTKQVFFVTNNSAYLSPAYGNLVPIQVPAVSPPQIPAVNHTFGEVYAYSLPSALTASEIPEALGCIYNCLSLGGTLHLALIDPMPIERTVGPLLRQWITANLSKTITQQFRCCTPSKTFRKWLQNANLRGPGSTITTASCKAILPSERKKLFRSSTQLAMHKEMEKARNTENMAISEIDQLSDLEAKTELRNLTGRLLWKQTWSRFVGAHKWWWDYPEVLQECMEYDTTWEYHLIEAVRA